MDAADAADAADVSDPAAVADAVDSGAAELLHSLSELLHQAASDLEAIDSRLRAKAPVPTASLREVATSIPVLDGNVNRLQLRVDAVEVGSEELRAQRRALAEQATALSERLQGLPAALAAVVESTANAHKEAGNAHFKRGDYKAAIDCYSAAIGADRKSAVYFSNRCACYMAQGNWTALGASPGPRGSAGSVLPNGTLSVVSAVIFLFSTVQRELPTHHR